jgi:hypothetical protein
VHYPVISTSPSKRGRRGRNDLRQLGSADVQTFAFPID